MLTEAEIAMRKTGLGGTDISRVCGESPFGTVHDVYREKIEQDVRPMTEWAGLGHKLEPVICDLTAERHGLSLAPATTERHPMLAWVLSTPDRSVMRDGARVALVETKLVGTWMVRHWEDEDSPPDYVRIQAQWNMTVTRQPVVYVGALVGGTEFRSFIIEHDDDLSTALLEQGQRFWEKHILAHVPPPPDGSESAKKMLRAAWPKASKAYLVATAPIEEAAATYFEAKAMMKEWEAKRDLAQQQLCYAIGENEGIAGLGWKATWKWGEPQEVKAHTREATRTFRATISKAKAA